MSARLKRRVDAIKKILPKKTPPIVWHENRLTAEELPVLDAIKKTIVGEDCGHPMSLGSYAHYSPVGERATYERFIELARNIEDKHPENDHLRVIFIVGSDLPLPRDRPGFEE